MVCCVSSSAESVFLDKIIRSTHEIELTLVDLPNPKPVVIPRNEDVITAVVNRWYPGVAERPPKLREFVKRALKSRSVKKTGEESRGACHTEAGVMAMVASIIKDEGSNVAPRVLRECVVCPLCSSC